MRSRNKDTSNAEVASIKKSKWRGIFLFVFAILLISTVATPFDPIYWILLPVALLFTDVVRTHRGIPKVSTNEFLILLTIISALVSFGFSDHQDISLTPTLYFVGIYMLLLTISMTLTSERDIGVLLIGVVTACFIVLMRSLFDIGTFAQEGSSRLEGVLGQSNATGSLAGVAIVSSLLIQRLRALEIVRLPKHRGLDIVIWGTLALGILVLLLSASRGSTAAVAVFLVLWLAPLLRRVNFGSQLVVGVGLIGVLWVAWARIAELVLFKRFWHLAWELGVAAAPPEGRFQESVGARDALKDIAVQIFYEHPVLGTGIGTFKAFSSFVYTHTTVYEILYSLGIFGMTLIAGLWGNLLLRFGYGALVKSDLREFYWLLVGVLIFLAIQGMTLPVVASRVHLPLMILVLAAARLHATGSLGRAAGVPSLSKKIIPE